MDLEPVHCETHDITLAPHTCKSIIISANRNRRAIKVFLTKNSGNAVPHIYLRFEKTFPATYQIPTNDACMVASGIWGDNTRVLFEDEDKPNKKCYRGTICFGLFNVSATDNARCNLSYYEY